MVGRFRKMGEAFGVDVMEEILKRLDVKDLIQCKSVCKWWRCMISCPCFVKAHMDYTYNNDVNDYKLGHRRIVTHRCSYESIEDSIEYSCCHLVGSSNGLVCVSPKAVRLLIANPSTREVKHLEKLPESPRLMRYSVCWGFGYDSSIDDYKVVVGVAQGRGWKNFYVLTLKSNTWEFIGRVRYYCGRNSKPGLLLNGSLYWFMWHNFPENRKNVIVSFDLSTHEFKEIPQPSYTLSGYECDMNYHTLGFIQDCLCIYDNRLPSTSVKWIMKENYSWETWSYDCEMGNGYLRAFKYKRSCKRCSRSCILRGDQYAIRLSEPVEYLSAPIYVETLVSPHVKANYDDDVNHVVTNTRKRKKEQEDQINVKFIKEDPLVHRAG